MNHLDKKLNILKKTPKLANGMKWYSLNQSSPVLSCVSQKVHDN